MVWQVPKTVLLVKQFDTVTQVFIISLVLLAPLATSVQSYVRSKSLFLRAKVYE